MCVCGDSLSREKELRRAGEVRKAGNLLQAISKGSSIEERRFEEETVAQLVEFVEERS